MTTWGRCLECRCRMRLQQFPSIGIRMRQCVGCGAIEYQAESAAADRSFAAYLEQVGYRYARTV